MASRRSLKKDIDAIYLDLMAEYFYAMAVSDNADGERWCKLHDDITTVFNKVVMAISQYPRQAGRKETKAFFKQVTEELLTDMERLDNELSQLSPKK